MSHSLQPHGLQHTRLLCPTLSQNLLKFMSTELVMISNHLILCHPFLLPTVFPSIRVVFSESALPIRWPKYWSFGISPSNEYSGLISLQSNGLSRVFFSTTVRKSLGNLGDDFPEWSGVEKGLGVYWVLSLMHWAVIQWGGEPSITPVQQALISVQW